MAASQSSHRIVNAFLTSLSEGVVELDRDWRSGRQPPIALEGKPMGFLSLKPVEPSDYAWESRYFENERGELAFVFNPEEYPAIDYDSAEVYLAGEFNGWGEAIGDSAWRLDFANVGGRDVLVLARPPEEVLGEGDGRRFKFVTDKGHWLPVDGGAPNVETDEGGNLNYVARRELTGRHRFLFRLFSPLSLSGDNYVVYNTKEARRQRVYLNPGEFFLKMRSDKELGAVVGEGATVFRLFAPRAKWVKLGLFGELGAQDRIRWILMRQEDGDGVWEARVEGNCRGQYYWFRLDGPECPSGMFDPAARILDPYAKAAVSGAGPGIVIDDRDYGYERPAFRPPQWQDLLVVEAHLRDLVARSKRARQAREEGRPIGFSDLAACADDAGFYPCELGANAIELQPVQENDSPSPEDYHWGYMTTNFFAPASSYARDPAAGSQVAEFRRLVEALHERGLAVILDVVYNHVGEPAHLMRIDKLYYFQLAADGSLTNWSGCGNDLRTDAPMVRRLLVESLERLVGFYGVDGFRFDLADLVGKPALVEVERHLKRLFPEVVLIAEPWSFRGHIGMELRDTGYASWNDGYREFVAKYVRGEGNQDGLAYFLKGSPDYYATWPAQTVNYVESHDDRVWIDKICENPEGDGSSPTLADQHRSRMMIAILMMSVGLPMLHAGQDVLQSKGGAINTYQDPERNALDCERALRYPGATAYFRRWIAFRQSERGRLLRHYSRAPESFFAFLRPEGRSALACVYNADGEKGPERLLFAANPDPEDLRLPLGEWAAAGWRQLADHERFFDEGERPLVRNDPADELFLPPLGCGLWVAS